MISCIVVVILFVNIITILYYFIVTLLSCTTVVVNISYFPLFLVVVIMGIFLDLLSSSFRRVGVLRFLPHSHYV